MAGYDPREFRALTFHDVVPKFRDGSDSPRAYLERCDAPSSLLFAPAVTVPLMAVDGMPVGVQVMGQRQQDARVTALARWLLANVPAVVVP